MGTKGRCFLSGGSESHTKGGGGECALVFGGPRVTVTTHKPPYSRGKSGRSSNGGVATHPPTSAASLSPRGDSGPAGPLRFLPQLWDTVFGRLDSPTGVRKTKCLRTPLNPSGAGGVPTPEECSSEAQRTKFGDEFQPISPGGQLSKRRRVLMVLKTSPIVGKTHP